MAGTYAPTVIVQATPFVSFTTSDLTTYAEITQSQGTVQYKIDTMYIKSKNINQINRPITFQQYGANGDLKNILEVNLMSPSQFQPAKNIDLSKKNIIFDGNMRMDVVVEPNEVIDIFFKVTKSEGSMFLKEGKEFFSEDFLDTYGFLGEYSDKINDSTENGKKQSNGRITRCN